MTDKDEAENLKKQDLMNKTLNQIKNQYTIASLELYDMIQKPLLLLLDKVVKEAEKTKTDLQQEIASLKKQNDSLVNIHNANYNPQSNDFLPQITIDKETGLVGKTKAKSKTRPKNKIKCDKT